jgi:hypothetical protein
MASTGAVIKPSRLSDLLSKPLTSAPSWIEPAVLPKGGTLLFGGQDKIGKTFLNLSLARALATGENLFEHPKLHTPEPCRVVLVDPELGEYGLQKRSASVFADLDLSSTGLADRLWYISKDPEIYLDHQPGRRKLREVVGDTQANVVLLDSVNMLHGYDENSNTEISRLFKFLDELKAEFRAQDLSIVLSHHFGKPPSGVDPRFVRDPLDRTNFRGAGKWTNAPDSLVTLQRQENLPTMWEAWELSCRFLLRQGESLPDMTLRVNEHKDLRVYYNRDLVGGAKLPRLDKKEELDDDYLHTPEKKAGPEGAYHSYGRSGGKRAV